MMEDLRARFLPRLRVVARGRVEQARVALAREDFGLAAGELHALAGEAAVLGIVEIADLARAGEAAVRRGDLAQVPLEALESAVAAL